jgi:hypothetical protein
LIADIALSVERIALGRKCFTIAGRGEERRLFYEDGITRAGNPFQAVQVAADPQIFMLAEVDKDVKSSLIKAIQSFRDAFRALEAVTDIPGYKTAEKTCPIDSDIVSRATPKTAIISQLLPTRLDTVSKGRKKRGSVTGYRQRGRAQRRKRALASDKRESI